MKEQFEKENLNLIIHNEFYSRPKYYIYYPDYNVYKRIQHFSENNKELFNKKEFGNINTFVDRHNSFKRLPGSFYHCRKLGITTKYDKELYDSFSMKALLTLFLCFIPGKIITSASLEKKYIKSSQVPKEYFKITATSFILGFFFIIHKKKQLDASLDEKYSAIYKSLQDNMSLK